MSAEINVQAIMEQVQRIAAETGTSFEEVLLVIAAGLDEPRRTQLIKAVIRRVESS